MRHMGAKDVFFLLSTEDSSNVKHVKADFAFYLLLACDFDIIYTILSSLSKNYMIKLEIEKKNVWYELLDGGVPGVLAGARPRAYLLI